MLSAYIIFDTVGAFLFGAWGLPRLIDPLCILSNFAASCRNFILPFRAFFSFRVFVFVFVFCFLLFLLVLGDRKRNRAVGGWLQEKGTPPPPLAPEWVGLLAGELVMAWGGTGTGEARARFMRTCLEGGERGERWQRRGDGWGGEAVGIVYAWYVLRTTTAIVRTGGCLLFSAL